MSSHACACPHMLAAGRASVLRWLDRCPFPLGLYLLKHVRCRASNRMWTAWRPCTHPSVRCAHVHIQLSDAHAVLTHAVPPLTQAAQRCTAATQAAATAGLWHGSYHLAARARRPRFSGDFGGDARLACSPGSLAPCVCKKVLASLRVKKCWRCCVLCRVVCTSVDCAGSEHLGT